MRNRNFLVRNRYKIWCEIVIIWCGRFGAKSLLFGAKSYFFRLSRQAAEGVFISKMEGEILNSKSEFHQPSIVTVRREINRGL